MTFQVPYAYGLLVLIIGVAFAAAFFAYRRSSFDGFYKYLLPGLRWFGLVCLGILLLKPSIVDRSLDEERPVIFWLQDESESLVNHSDSAEYLQNYFSWKESSIAALEEQYDVVGFGFDERVHPAQDNFKGTQSAPGVALEEMMIRAEGRNVAGVVLATDGIANAGVSLNAQLRSVVPIYSLALGDSTHYPDLRIVEVRNNPVAFVGNTTPIIAQLEIEALSTDRTKVDLFKNGEKIQSIYTSFNNGFAQAKFEIEADTAGIENFEIRVPVVGGERNSENNTAYTRIEFVANERVIDIIYAAPHPDIASLRLPVISDPSYQVNLIQRNDWQGSASASSDLLIFHQCMPSARELDEILVNDQSFLIVTSENRPYSNWSRLNSIFGNSLQLERISDVSGRENESFTAFKIESDWSAKLGSFPPLKSEYQTGADQGIWKPVLLANVGRVETQTPLLSIAKVGNQRMGWMNGEGWWRWRSYSFAEFGSHSNYDGTILQLYRWLLTKPGADRLIVEHPIRINSGELMNIVARPKDEAMQPFTGALVSLKLTLSNGDKVERQFEETLEGVYQVQLSELLEGAYSYEISAKLGSEVLTQRGKFLVQDIHLEKQDTRARFDLLSAISERTGGKMYSYAEREELITDLIALDPPAVLHESVSTESLLKKWWPWVLIVLTFALEWALRKREGQV